MTTFADLVAAGAVAENVQLGPLTTYRFGGVARWMMDVDGEDDLIALARARVHDPVPVFLLGRGSNVVVASSGFPGVVVRPGGALNRWNVDHSGRVEAGSAVPLPVLARGVSRAGWGGLEWFVGVPGSVGGAVCMNAGCFGSDTASVLVSARIVDLDTAAVHDRTPAELEMGYRTTNVRSTDAVVSAVFSTVERDPQKAQERIREITRWRKEHQPGGTLNAGSVFKNPPGDAAGRLIDAAGLKGFRIGGVAVSERHANFFVAGEDATPEDLFRLVAGVRNRVHAAFGVVLTPEVRFIGDFEGVE